MNKIPNILEQAWPNRLNLASFLKKDTTKNQDSSNLLFFDEKHNLQKNQQSLGDTLLGEPHTSFVTTSTFFNSSWGTQILAHVPVEHDTHVKKGNQSNSKKFPVNHERYREWRGLLDLPSPEMALDLVERCAMNVSCRQLSLEEMYQKDIFHSLVDSDIKHLAEDTLTPETTSNVSNIPPLKRSSIQQLNNAFEDLTSALLEKFT